MGRHILRLAVALLAFVLGVTAASVWLGRRCRTNDKASSSSASHSLSNRSVEDDREAERLKRLLSDFFLVGSGAYDPSIPSHGMEAEVLPTKFDDGKQYVFHSLYSDNNYHYEQLQRRVRAEGFEIIAADGSMYRYIGGMLFQIRFRDATHEFTLFNEPDRRILGNMERYKGWSIDDYVLVVERSSN
jgi:hypothetical protein